MTLIAHAFLAADKAIKKQKRGKSAKDTKKYFAAKERLSKLRKIEYNIGCANLVSRAINNGEALIPNGYNNPLALAGFVICNTLALATSPIWLTIKAIRATKTK